MYIIVVFVSWAGIAAAFQCCAPRQWECQVSFLTTVVSRGKPNLARGSVTMAFDAVRRRVVQYENIMISNRPSLSLGVLMDYDTRSKYVFHENTCYREVLDRKEQDFSACIPDTATMVSSNDVVGYGDNSMVLTTYALDFPDNTAYLSLTPDCLPVMETIKGNISGRPFLQNIHYFNISTGISHLDALKVPPNGCENAATVESSFSQTGANSLLGRRSFLGF